ncbi:hypothetical protein Ahy_B01g054555 [Arachis hypogaea]|uniref:Uncharacterized protein n=1 Tax=Arachis hypogaea TaxID=3818 RepID=A0A445AU17_ARAHY|nr:hypothetical protein Ahy_B01g054555 [Arachis hypogaea]
MNDSHALLRELIDHFDEEKRWLKTLQGRIYITPQKVAAALSITNGGNRFNDKVDYNNLNPEDKKIFYSVKNISLVTLTGNVLDMNVEGEENRKKFKRTFVVFIQNCFLLPTMVSVASPIISHRSFMSTTFGNGLGKELKTRERGKKLSVDGCVFVLMFIYFHETKFPRPFAPDAPPAPLVAHWTKKMMLERISKEATEPLHISIIRDFCTKKEKKNEKTETRKLDKKEKGKKIKRKIVDLDSSSEEERFSESESQSETDKRPPTKRARQKKVLIKKDSQSTSETETIPTDSKSKSESKNH